MVTLAKPSAMWPVEAQALGAVMLPDVARSWELVRSLANSPDLEACAAGAFRLFELCLYVAQERGGNEAAAAICPPGLLERLAGAR